MTLRTEALADIAATRKFFDRTTRVRHTCHDVGPREDLMRLGTSTALATLLAVLVAAPMPPARSSGRPCSPTATAER